MAHGLPRVRKVFVRSLVRRLLVVGGLVVAGWPAAGLGDFSGTAHADVAPPRPMADGALREGAVPAVLSAVAPVVPVEDVVDALPAGPERSGIGQEPGDLVPAAMDPFGGLEQSVSGVPGRVGAGGPGGTPWRRHDSAADAGVRAVAQGSRPPAETAATGSARTDERRSGRVRHLVDDRPSPLGGDRPPPVAAPTVTGTADGSPDGCLGLPGRAGRPDTMPDPGSAGGFPAVRTTADESFFAPD